MYCLANMCYVCLEKKDKSLINIKNSSVNKDLVHILKYLPFNLEWLTTKQIILICEQCCTRLRETYQVLAKYHKNSSLMQSYMENLNTRSISNTNNEAELRVELHNMFDDLNVINLEVTIENGENICTFTKEPTIEQTEHVFVNVNKSFVKEDNLEREEVNNKEESPVDNNFVENNDNETDLEISGNSNTYDMINQSVVLIPEHKPSTVVSQIGEQNLPIKCKVCSMAFPTRGQLNKHIVTVEHVTTKFCKYCKQSVDIVEFDAHFRQHENDVYFCEYCGEIICDLQTFKRHTRIHRQHKCPLCPMQFHAKFLRKAHLTEHTGMSQDQCKYCNRKFARFPSLIRHLASRTCQARYECTICNRTFRSEKYYKNHQRLVHHIE